MTETNVFQLAQPGTFSDSLTAVLREGARTLLARAVEAEVADFLVCHADRTTADGRRRIVRHGHLPERSIMTGIGPVTVRQPRVRDRAADAGERLRFSPNILPRYARRTKSLEALIPILYLKGVSTGDFEEALSARMRPACRLRPSPASRRRGARSMTAGASAICLPNGTSIGGSTAFIWRRVLRIRRNAFS